MSGKPNGSPVRFFGCWPSNLGEAAVWPRGNRGKRGAGARFPLVSLVPPVPLLAGAEVWKRENPSTFPKQDDVPFRREEHAVETATNKTAAPTSLSSFALGNG